jgi:hypothetical protein
MLKRMVYIVTTGEGCLETVSELATFTFTILQIDTSSNVAFTSTQ